MKVVSFTLVLLSGANAFSPCGQNLSRQPTQLAAEESRRAFGASVANLALGWASVATSANAVELDFSLPSYDTKMSGFGQGTEAILNSKTDDLTDPGANEKIKQEEAAKKAAYALRDDRNRKAEMRKLQYEADKQRALEKKARDAERLKNIWSS
jgi:hypothetical protein